MIAVVLLSGGLDSAVALAMTIAAGRTCHALSFRYGQRHVVELEAAARVAASVGAYSHRIVDIDAAALAGSALTGAGQVPKGRSLEEIGKGIPTTYVPARNTLFVAHAVSLAETVGAEEVVLGINALDYSGYPDCRPEWVAAMQKVIDFGTRGGIRLVAPLVHMTKVEIVRVGRSLGVDLSITHSCYDPTPEPCGSCDSCIIRAAALAEA